MCLQRMNLRVGGGEVHHHLTHRYSMPRIQWFSNLQGKGVCGMEDIFVGMWGLVGIFIIPLGVLVIIIGKAFS